MPSCRRITGETPLADVEVYSFTSGEYSDYRVRSVLLGPPGQDMSALGREYEAWCKKNPKECHYLPGLMQRREPDVYEFHEWLVEHRGFLCLPSHEVWCGGYGWECPEGDDDA